MLLKNNNFRPAYASACSFGSSADKRNFAESATFNMGATDEVKAFGAFGDAPSSSNAPRRTASAPKSPKKKAAIPYWVWIIVAAVVVVALIAVIAVSVFTASGNIEATDNTYIAFSEDNQTYQVAVNGTVLDEVFEGETEVIPSLDRSFAYIFCHGNEGELIYVLRDKKLEPITMEGSEVTDIICYSALKPGIVYAEDGVYYLYSEEMGEDLITKTEGADNFIISDDASTVVYTLPVEDSADEYKIYYYKNGSSDSLGVKNCTPIMLSNDGAYIYGKAYTATTTEKLYCITAEDGEKYPVGDGNFGGISAINADGDEIIYYSLLEGRYSSYIYNAKKDTSYEIAKNKGIFVPATVDRNVVRYGSFKDIYLQSISLGDMLDSESSVSGYTYYINKKYEAEPIASAVGQFSPDGKYFYYIKASSGALYQVDLSDSNSSDKKIYEDTIDFAITQKGNVYMLNDDNALYFYKPSTQKKDPINKVTELISMHDYANRLYYITEDGDVFVTEEGSKGETVKFDSIQLTQLPYFSDSHSKRTFAYVYDNETSTWSIFYTSNGKSFNKIVDQCDIIYGVDTNGLLSDIVG